MRRLFLRILRWLAITIVALIVIVQAMLWSPLPKRIVIGQIEEQLGLRISADNLSTGNSAGYAGMTVSLLQAYDSAIVPTKLNIQTATSVTYCVDSTVGGKVWDKAGPGADIVSGACP